MNRIYIIVFAVLVGVCSVLPYLLSYILIPANGEEKLHYFYQDSELAYLSRIREIAEGNIHVSSPVFFEYKGTPNLQQPFGEWLYAIFSFGNPELIPEVAIASKFVLPALLWVLVLLFIKKLLDTLLPQASPNKYVAWFVATLVVLLLEFNHFGFWKQVFVSESTIPYLSLWTRLVNPITGALGLFALFYLLLEIGEKKKSLHIIAAGLIFGFMSGYIFSFALAGLMVFGMLIAAGATREWSYARSLLCVLVIGLLINSLYIGSILFGEHNEEALLKSGLLLTHNILHNKILYISGVAFLVFTVVYRRLYPEAVLFQNRAWQWACVALLSGIVALNEQVVTGKTVWPGHFVQYTNPAAYIIFFSSVYAVLYGTFQKASLRARYEKFVRSAAVLGVLAILSTQIVMLVPVFSPMPAYRDLQRYAHVLTWLNEGAPDPCVVFVYETKERIEKLITAYTHCDLYHSSYVYSGVPPERIMHNYLVYLRMQGIPSENINTYLNANEDEIHQIFFKDWVDHFPYNGDTWLMNTKSEHERNNFLSTYKNKIADAYAQETEPLGPMLNRYRIDYIVYDKTYGEPHVQGVPVEEVAALQNVVLLRVK